jgi:hypothetical protein
MPVRIAQERARSAWTSRRAGSPVIQRLSPLARAMRPSSEAAVLTRIHGPAAAHAREEPDVRLFRLRGHEAEVHADAGLAQLCGARAVHQGIRVLERCHDAPDLGRDQRIDAGWGAAVVGARFE